LTRFGTFAFLAEEVGPSLVCPRTETSPVGTAVAPVSPSTTPPSMRGEATYHFDTTCYSLASFKLLLVGYNSVSESPNTFNHPLRFRFIQFGLVVRYVASLFPDLFHVGGVQ